MSNSTSTATQSPAAATHPKTQTTEQAAPPEHTASRENARGASLSGPPVTPSSSATPSPTGTSVPRAASPSSPAPPVTNPAPTEPHPQPALQASTGEQTEKVQLKASGPPVLPASLWVAGAVLWAYVVMGELVVVARFPESLAWLIVLVAYGLAWRRAVKGASSKKLTVAPGIVGPLLCYFFVAFASMAFGSSSRHKYEAVTVALWVFSVAAYVMGRWLTPKPWTATAPQKTKLQKAGTALLWAISGLTSALAMVIALDRV